MTRTIVHRTHLDAAGAKAQGLRKLPFSDGLFETASSSASLESPVLESPAGFDDLVGSWNADVPPGGRLELQAQVKTEQGWSGWFALGRAEGESFVSAERQER
ncbi:MAG: hypothetical protein L0206_15140, partial [Actinobacteria bacterium]|nr:hypothetical protein [Actinomycetota bacterium]